MGPYRFFFHYYKAKKAMSFHWKNTCYVIDNIVCLVPTESKWNKHQPNLVMRGWANKIEINHMLKRITVS